MGPRGGGRGGGKDGTERGREWAFTGRTPVADEILRRLVLGGLFLKMARWFCQSRADGSTLTPFPPPDMLELDGPPDARDRPEPRCVSTPAALPLTVLCRLLSVTREGGSGVDGKRRGGRNIRGKLTDPPGSAQGPSRPEVCIHPCRLPPRPALSIHPTVLRRLPSFLLSRLEMSDYSRG